MEQGTGNKGTIGKPQGFRGLMAWQKADELASATYCALRDSPPANRWLAQQAMRAAISVPANTAEGNGRRSVGDYLRFLDIARGSLSELEYYILFLEREGLLPASETTQLNNLREDTGRLLHGLWSSLKKKSANGTWDRSARIGEEQGVYIADAGSDSEDDL